MTGRNPDQVGYQWCAWWALQGDEPLSYVHTAALDLQEKLGALSAQLHSTGDFEGSKIVAAAALFNSAIGELLDEAGVSEFQIKKIERRRAGKPLSKHERALRGRQAGEIARKLIDEGLKAESAVQRATDETGLSRAEVFAWLKSNRAAIKMGEDARERLKTPGKPKFLE